MSHAETSTYLPWVWCKGNGEVSGSVSGRRSRMRRDLRVPVLGTALPCLVQVISLDWGASSSSGIKGCFPFQFSLKSVSFFLANHNTLLVVSQMFFWVNAHSRFLLNSHIFTLLASWSPQILFILANCEYGKLLLNNALYEQEDNYVYLCRASPAFTPH